MTTGGEVVVTGYVEVIGLLYTVMRNEQGACVSIPNKARLPATFRCAQHCSLLLLLQPAFALVAPFHSVVAHPADCHGVPFETGTGPSSARWTHFLTCTSQVVRAQRAGVEGCRRLFAAQLDGVDAGSLRGHHLSCQVRGKCSR